MRKAIINADDFGLSPGVNRGIVSAFREGVLTSTTMMANMAYFDDAVALARDNPDLPIGVHLTLLWGRPVRPASEVPTLVDAEGYFPRSAGVLARRYYTGKLSVADVEREFTGQIEKVVEAGVQPTHLDTHKHVHAFPRILDGLVGAARRFGIDKIRVPYERELDSGGNGATRLPRPSWKGRTRRNVIRYLCRNARSRLREAGLRTTDHFVGIDFSDRLDSNALGAILRGLHDGVTEIMCHPGIVDAPMKEYARIPPLRELELSGLKDDEVRRIVTERNIRLTHYGEL